MGCGGDKDDAQPDTGATSDCAYPVTWYRDQDGDGFGDPDSETLESCEQPAGAASNAEDCDDTDVEIYPGSEERCDAIDNDCDGEVDEEVMDTWYLDGDGDGYGDPDTSGLACEQPSGMVANSDDCDDSDAAKAPELDADGDGYFSCEDDCDDSDAERNPGIDADGDGVSACDDCDDLEPSFAEMGAYFIGADGVMQDVTDSLNEGDSAFNEAGQLLLCPREWDVQIAVEADLDIQGAWGPEDTILNPTEDGSVVSVTTSGIDVGLSNLTLSGGTGTPTLFG